MIADDMEERHLQLADEALGLVPLPPQFRLARTASVDEIADGHHELGTKKVDRVDALLEEALAFPARPVRDDGEVELLRIVEERLVRPRLHIALQLVAKLGGNRRQLEKRQQNQSDGKRIDHIYQYHDLTNNENEKPIYYIGDSKYYKRGHKIGDESVYKQFTYARNVIQWNLDLFNDGKEDEQRGQVKLRDDISEGYNVIPNFFISAQQNTLDSSDDIRLTDNQQKYFQSRTI